MTGNYHNLDLVNIDAHTKLGLIMSICSQDIERKLILTSIKGHNSVKILRKFWVMIYIYIGVLEPSMLHAKFR